MFVQVQLYQFFKWTNNVLVYRIKEKVICQPEKTKGADKFRTLASASSENQKK